MNNRYNPKIHHRRSIRLRGYDYSRSGLYFITICTRNRLHLFGKIINGIMALNDAGKMVEQIWNKIPNDFNHTRLHEFIIMPNHTHGIIEITPATPVGADSISAPMDTVPTDTRAEMDSAPTSLVAVAGIPQIIQSFKRCSTIAYINMVKQNILPPFDKRVWQRNYWEHIIRNENEYYRIAQYIMDNPKKWALDKLNGGVGNQVMEPQATYNEEAWMV